MRTFFFYVTAPSKAGMYNHTFQLQDTEANPVGDSVTILLKVKEVQKEDVAKLKPIGKEYEGRYNASLKGSMNAIKGKLGSEETMIKFTTINRGSEEWPATTNLYLVDYKQFNPF